MKMTKKRTAALIKGMTASVLAPILLTSATTVSAAGNTPEIEANAALAIEFETGKVLLDQHADEQLGIASMTKMMVEYILFEAIKNKELSWDDQLPVSDYAQAVSQNYILSNVPLRAGETYSVKEMYEALAIYSANGATIVLAEAIAGNEPAFVDLMKKKAEEWGIENYHLVNTTGLNNSYLNGHLYPGSTEKDENSMTAKGIAKVAVKLLQDYPEVLDTSSVPEKIFREGTSDAISMKNWNWMLPGLIYERKNVDGLKTGTTEYAGASITGTAVEGDRRIITVVMGAGDGETNKAQRFKETGKLLDYSFNNWESYEAAKEGDIVKAIEPITVSKGKEKTVALKAGSDLNITAPKGTEENQFEITFRPDAKLFDENGAIVAPVEKGAEVGTFIIKTKGDNLGYLDGSKEEEIPAVAAESVKKANVFSLAASWIKGTVQNLVAKFKK